MKCRILFLMFVMFVGLCFGGDFIFPDNGDKIIWPGGEMEFGADDIFIVFGSNDNFLGILNTDSDTVTFDIEGSVLFDLAGGILTWDGSALDTNLSTHNLGVAGDQSGGEGWNNLYIGGLIQWNGASGQFVDTSISRQRLNGFRWITSDNLQVNSDLDVLGDTNITGRLFVNNNEIGGSIRLFGSSTNEFLVVAQYTNVSQQAGANKFELRITGTFTGGSDTDYELEIDGTSPATFKWRKDTGGGFGAYTTGVAVPLSFTELDEAIKIAFLDSGSDVFVIGDDYSFTAVNTPDTILNVDTQTPLVTVAELLSSNGVTVSDLTAGRVTFAGAAGVLTDDADLTFSTDTLTATKISVGDFSVTNSATFGGVDLTNCGNVVPSVNTKELGDVGTNWGGIWLDGKIGIPAINHTLDFNISSSFAFLMGGTDCIITMDGSSTSPLSFTYESDNDLLFIDKNTVFNSVIFLAETTTPTPIASHAAIYTKSNNELFYQSGDGAEHLLHGDAFSNIWLHSTSSVEVAIAVQDSYTAIDSFAVVGHEDDLANLVGNTTTNSMTLAAIAGGEYELSYHGSVTATGGADKEMSFAVGITLATPKDITNVTDNGVSPIVITSVGHDLDNGDMVEIVDVLVNTAANGSFIVDNKATDTFEIVALDGGATTGNGDYNEGSPTGDVTIFYPGNMEIHRMVRGADFGSIAAADLHVLSGGDVLKLYVANLSGVTNLTVSSISLSGFRIGD